MSGRGIPFLYPTRHLAGLLCLLAAMWYAGASQNNPAAYSLLVLLTAAFLVSIPYTLFNLTGLKVTVGSVKPAFAGQEVSIPVEIMNEGRIARHTVAISVPEAGPAAETIDELSAGKASRVTVRFPASSRGEHRISWLGLTTVYPLGFLRVGRRVGVERRYLVYPQPKGDPKLPTHRRRSAQSALEMSLGEGDDFAGVRLYVAGESQRHIDWKAVARGQAIMTKQFATESQGLLYLDFAALPFSDPEQRLSQLALWVIEAERARRPYGLRLPGTEIAPSAGEPHSQRCLRALALFK